MAFLSPPPSSQQQRWHAEKMKGGENWLGCEICHLGTYLALLNIILMKSMPVNLFPVKINWE